MVMWQDPAQQAYWEEQARLERERLLSQQEAAAREAAAKAAAASTTQTSSTSQQGAQLEALQWGQSGNPAPPTPTTEPIYTNPLPNQPVTSPEAQDALHDRAVTLDTKIQQQNIQEAQTNYDSANKELTEEASKFDSTWSSKIQGNEFVGTEAEYAQYIKEAEQLNSKGKTVSALVGRLNSAIGRVNETNDKESKRFLERNVQLVDGKYISKSGLERIRQENPAMYRIIADKGIAGYEAFISEYNDSSGEKKFNLLKNNGFIESGARYVGDDEQGNPLFMSGKQANTMDKIKYYNDSPSLALSKKAVTTDQLKEIGYSDDQVQRFVDAVAESRSSRVALPGESGFKQQWNRDYAKAEAAFNQAADRIEQENPKATKEQIAAMMLTSPEYQALQDLNEQVPDTMMTEFTIAHRAVIVGGSTFVFSPARSLLPEVKASDISGMEWAVGGAQVALLAVPVVGVAARGATGGAAIALREVEFGVQAGAAAIFTKETVDNWDYLKKNPWQAGLSVAMDALIIGSAAGSLSKLAATARAEQIANIEARARKIVVNKFMDSATGRIDPKVKQTFTRIPTAPLEQGTYLPVKYDARLPSFKQTLVNTAKAIRTGDRQLLIDSGKQMQYLALKDPSSPMAKLMYSRGKQLETHADDWIKLAKKEVPASERQALEDAIKANQGKADEIERALKRGIKNPETRRIAEETLQETRRQLKTQIKEVTKPLPKEKVIWPSEQGKNLPATREGTEIKPTEKPRVKPSEDPRIKSRPSPDTDIQVTIRAGEGADIYVGYVSFPTSDPDSQRRYLEALKNTYTRQGYVVEVTPNEDVSAQVLEDSGLQMAGKTGTGTTKWTSPDTGTTPGSSPREKVNPTPFPNPRTNPNPSPKPFPKPSPKPAPYPQPKEVPEPQPFPQPKPYPTPETPVPIPTPTPTDTEKPPVPKIDAPPIEKVPPRGKNQTDSEKRDIIAAADTKAGWVQGSLTIHGKKVPVSHVVVGKDGEYQHMVVTGALPEGVPLAKGKGQAYESITLTKGVPPTKPVMLEGGAIDPVVIPEKRGVTIWFIPEKDVKERRKPDKRFTINRRGQGIGKSRDLGMDIVRDRRGRHLRL